MATYQQIWNFEQQYFPLAQQVGNATGNDPMIPLSQWALETGYGQDMAGTYNLGGFENPSQPGGSSYQSFSSPADFGTAYTNLLQQNYPGALNQGNNIAGFVQGLNNSSGESYYGNGSADGISTADYTSRLQGVEQTLQNVQGQYSNNPITYLSSIGSQIGSLLSGNASLVNGSAVAPTSASSASADGTPSGLGAFIAELAERGGLILLGMVFIIGAFYLLGTKDSQTVTLRGVASKGLGKLGELGAAA
jgi:hypothetical protein